ncbi:MAG: translation initiation factor IF-3 [bacterium]|nr:translation initiation factor IF-3 [bacterium]
MQQSRVNHQIQAPEVRLINDEGEQLGIIKLNEALKLADEHGLDLVEISPNAKPPVVKLISYDKFKYQQKKLEQQQKKKVKKIEVKTVRLSVKIAGGDLMTKARQTDGFLEDGDWVKVELRMRGREQAFIEVAQKQIQTFRDALTVPYRIEVEAKKMGNTLSMTIAPTK